MIPIGIVTHPQRGAMARELELEVGAEAISWDDQGNLGCEGNHPQLWSYLQSATSPWVCVLEDDAVPCENFRNQLDTMLVNASTPIVSLYLGRGRPDQWQLPISSVISYEACFIRSDTLINTVGYVIRTELLPSLIRSMRQSLRQSAAAELPVRMSNWARSRKHRISYTRPSLVDHADVPTISEPPGTPKRRACERKAWLFDARDRWNDTYVELPRPNFTRLDKVARHEVVVRHAAVG